MALLKTIQTIIVLYIRVTFRQNPNNFSSANETSILSLSERQCYNNQQQCVRFCKTYNTYDIFGFKFLIYLNHCLFQIIVHTELRVVDVSLPGP